jgi:hypothetical protein
VVVEEAEEKVKESGLLRAIAAAERKMERMRRAVKKTSPGNRCMVVSMAVTRREWRR